MFDGQSPDVRWISVEDHREPLMPGKKKAKRTDYGPCSRCGSKIEPSRPYFGPPKDDDSMPDFFCSGRCRDKGVSE